MSTWKESSDNRSRELSQQERAIINLSQHPGWRALKEVCLQEERSLLSRLKDSQASREEDLVNKGKLMIYDRILNAPENILATSTEE